MARRHYIRGRQERARTLDMRNYVGMGPLIPGGDAITGEPLPRRLAVKQRGRWVHQDWDLGSRDKPDTW